MKLDKNLLMLLGAVLCAFLFTFSFNKERPSDPLQYTEFLRMVRENKITEVTMNQGIVGMMDVVDVNKNKLTVNAPFDKDLLNDLIRFGVNTKIREAEQPSFWFNLFISWFPMLLLIGVWIYFMRKSTGGGGGGIFGMTKSRAQLTTSNVRFDDVAGCDEAKEDVKEFVDFLKDPTRYSQLGGKLPKGALLVGPPGTGKTLLAKAIAGEAGVPFFSLSGSDFVEMFVGVGAARAKDLFEQAKKNSPCIIFIDEIDAVGKQRGNSNYGGNDEREQTLNQLLVQMDGFSETSGIIVLAATNRVDILDEALRRPGRFDREIHVTNPDVRGREQILMVHAKKLPLGPDVNLVQLAQGTPGFSGADLANLVNEAALYAGRDNKKFVCMADFEHAKDKVMMGSERKSMIMPEHERRNTAYHEAGHTVVGVMIGNDPVHKVSIIPRGRALGVTMHSPDEDRYCLDKDHLKAELAVLMGGRAAEEVFMGQVTTGASNDMERASKIARNMVTVWGMSDKLGPLNYATENVYSGSHFSSDTLKLIDSEVRDLVNNAYDRAKTLLIEHKDETTALAEALLVKETLNDEEIVAFLPNAPEKSLRNINKRKI